MSNTPTILRGTVHGKTIELDVESRLPEGQQVTVTLEPVPQQHTVAETSLEALKRAAGTWSTTQKVSTVFWNGTGSSGRSIEESCPHEFSARYLCNPFADDQFLFD